MAAPTMPREVTDAGPANSITDAETGSRVYVHPVTGERFVSVTTVLGIVGKHGLPYWAAKVVQETAMDMIPLLVKSLRRKPCEQKGDDRCGLCRDCVGLELRRAPDRERDEAADRGRRIHTVAEHYTLTGEIRPHDADIKPYVEQWVRWRDQHQVTFDASEVTVINRTFGYAGTLDKVVRCGWMPPKWKHLIGLPLYGDYKSGKGIYDEHAWQIAAYRHGEAVLLPDGSEHPMPDGHDEIGLTVQIRPEDFWQRPMRVCARAFRGFTDILAVFRDLEDDDFDLVGRAMYKPRAASDSPTTTDET